jgi:CDP-glucose 4,6-dehydratase
MFKAFAGRRVLVTGHTGFCGSWLSMWLHALGANVFGIAKSPEATPNLYDDLSIWGPDTSFICDIAEPGRVTQIVRDLRPEVVFHLAAQPLVRQSYADPGENYRSNVIGTVEVLEAVRQTESIEAAVFVTTDKVYQNNEWVYPYRETDRLGGKDPYSASKAACEIVISSYVQSMLDPDRIGISVARGGNIIGGGDWSKDRLIPDIVRAVISDSPLVLRNPESTRPWQHVLALCHGYLQLAEGLLTEGGRFTGAWNFGPVDNQAITTRRLVDMFAASWKTPGVRVEPSSLAEAKLLALDCSKARLDIGWVPAWSTEESVRKTVEWYQRFYDGEVGELILREQITEYTESLGDSK